MIVASSNRTLLIEVKTANLARESASDSAESADPSTKGQDTLYKLDSVGHELARNFSENWLISARSLSEPDLERARDKPISVFAPTDRAPANLAIAGFEAEIQRWIAQGRERVPMDRSVAYASLPVSSDWARRARDDTFANPTPADAAGAPCDNPMAVAPLTASDAKAAS